jgi:hypothetical protein
MIADGGKKEFLAVWLGGRTFDFVKAIGEKHDDVTARDGTGGSGIGGFLEEAEGGTGFVVGVFENFDFAKLTMNDEGLGMAGVGVVDLARFQIDNHVEGGGEKGRAGLLEDGADVGIDAREELAGIGGDGMKFFDEGANHRRNQGGADAVAHDVANEEARFLFGNAEDVEEVAADLAGGVITVAELEEAFFRGNAERETRVALGEHGELDFAGHFQVLFHNRVLLAQLGLAAGEFGVHSALAFFGGFAFGDVAEDAEQKGAAFLQIDEGVVNFQIDGFAGAEGDAQVESQIGGAVGKALLIDAGQFGQILIFGVADGEVASDQLLGGHAGDVAEGTIDGEDDPLLVRQPHAVGGALPDGAETGFGEAKFFLGFLTGGDVIDEAFKVLQGAFAVAHGAGVFRNPDDGAVFAIDLRFEVGDDAFLLHKADEVGATVGIDVEQAGNVADAGHQFFGGSVTINAGEGGIDIEVAAFRRGLKNAGDGVFKDAAVFFLGLEGGAFRLSALDGVKNGAQEQRRGGTVFDEIVFGASVNGVDGGRFVIQAAQDDDGNFGSGGADGGEGVGAGTVGQVQIGQHDVERGAAEAAQSFRQAESEMHVEARAAGFFQSALQEFDVAGIVLDEQDFDLMDFHAMTRKHITTTIAQARRKGEVGRPIILALPYGAGSSWAFRLICVDVSVDVLYS